MRRNLEMLPPPESDSAGSTQQITAGMKRKSLQELEEMEASLGHLRNHHKAKRNGK